MKINELLEAKKPEDLEAQFKEMFPATKSIYHLKPGNAEDVAHDLMKLFKIGKQHKYERFAYDSHWIKISDDKKYGMFGAEGRGGIPTYIMGFQEKSEWPEILQKLKDSGSEFRDAETAKKARDDKASHRLADIRIKKLKVGDTVNRPKGKPFGKITAISKTGKLKIKDASGREQIHNPMTFSK